MTTWLVTVQECGVEHEAFGFSWRLHFFLQLPSIVASSCVFPFEHARGELSTWKI